MENDNILTQTELDDKLRRTMYSHDYAEAKWLVENGANPNTTSGWGSPFIYWCAEKGKIDLIDTALLKGANVNGTNKSGETALHKAAYVGKIDVIDYLIDHGANINHRNIYDATPLFVAVLRDQAEAVRRLIARGADPSIKNYKGVSAAQKAMEKGLVAIAALLTAV